MTQRAGRAPAGISPGLLAASGHLAARLGMSERGQAAAIR